MTPLHFLTTDSDHLQNYLSIQRNRIVTFLAEKDKELSDELLQETTDFISELTELSFTPSLTKLLLDFDPMVRSQLIRFNDLDTAMRGELADTVANFFLGVSWPERQDSIDMRRFLSLLQSEAEHLDLGTKG